MRLHNIPENVGASTGEGVDHDTAWLLHGSTSNDFRNCGRGIAKTLESDNNNRRWRDSGIGDAPRRLLRNPRMSRCCQFSEDRKEPSAGRSLSATDKLGDIARAENWRNPEGVSVTCVGFSTVS